MRRRRFLQAAGLSAAAALLPEPLRGRTLPLPSARSSRPVRVSGQVRGGGRGIPRVAVSDGLTVVDTAADGTFELVSTAERGRVYLSVPSGYRMPVGAPGIARFDRPVQADSRGEARVEFDLEPLPAGEDRHAFLLLADIQTENDYEMSRFRAETIPDLIRTRRRLEPIETFGVACGDIMFDRLDLFDEYRKAVAPVGIPFLQVVGNHDMDPDEAVDERSTRTFSKWFGPRYYSFDRGAVHYVVLDDVFSYGSGYLGYLDRDQLEWLARDLERVEAGRTVVVFLHIPATGSHHSREGREVPDASRSLTNRDVLDRLLEPFRAHLLAGHMHENEHLFRSGMHEHVVAAVCGAWWSGPICSDGTPNGYAVYEVRGESVSWRYRPTGATDGTAMRVYRPGSDPSFPSSLVANVWDWDPGWSVIWYEDGERRGAMARRVARDPWSVVLHEGPNRPVRRKWVDPYPTGHLFFAEVGAGARRITVEAVDRFGRVHVAEPVAVDRLASPETPGGRPRFETS